jgi:hypothetical protein
VRRQVLLRSPKLLPRCACRTTMEAGSRFHCSCGRLTPPERGFTIWSRRRIECWNFLPGTARRLVPLGNHFLRLQATNVKKTLPTMRATSPAYPSRVTAGNGGSVGSEVYVLIGWCGAGSTPASMYRPPHSVAADLTGGFSLSTAARLRARYALPSCRVVESR